jgi:subtilisin-like proprotein convertase family protein
MRFNRKLAAGRIGVAVALTLACSGVALLASAAPAMATVFSNAGTITMPDPDCTDPDTATPYPSNISVAGLSGTVSDVNVTLNGVTHPFEGDIEILLVSPAGGTKNIVLLSDAGTGSLSNATVTFDDSAASQPPQNSAWGPGTYKPSNYPELSKPDVFPAPAPAASSNTTLATAFNGIVPNGTWSLFVTDDACADAGSIGGGWSIDISTVVGAATTTVVNSSPNPSTTGAAATFTATVTSSGSPVTSGTVTFSEGATVLAANVAVNGSGQASFVKSNFAEGNHIVTATYNGVATFNTSSGSVNHRVNNPTTVTGSSYCNTGAITVNAQPTAIATPYPSNILVAGASPYVVKVTATLKNVSHMFPDDIDVLLVGPTGQNLVLVSDAGLPAGPPPAVGANSVTVNFDDAAAGQLAQSAPWGAPGSTVSSKPVDYDPAAQVDVFPAPAPAPSASTALSTFNATNPNGTWALYVVSDGAPDTGTIANGWCLNFTFDTTPPSVSIVQAAGQADPTQHSPINFTATFSEAVTGFTGSDVLFTGSTAGGAKVANVTGGPAIYNVAVTGMTTSGSVIATIPAGAATDIAGNGNTASSGGDNTVGWVLDTTAPTCSYTIVPTPAPAHIDFTVQDVGSGIASITFPTLNNIVTPVPVPAFSAGTTSPVSFTATKANNAQRAQIAVVITDMAGVQASCV